jgi:MFS family permease
MRTPNERKVILSASLGHFFSHYVMLVFPALVTVLAHDFDATLAEVLRASTPGYLLYGLGALPAGLLTDRYGARWLLTACLAGCCLGALGAALARDLVELTIALATLGAASSLYHPAGMTLITRNVAQAGSALGTNGVFGNLGIALAPFVTGLAAAIAGWRSAYALAALAIGVVTIIVLRLRPEDRAATRSPDSDDQASHARFLVSALPLSLIAIAVTCAGLGYRASSVTLPTFFEQQVAPVDGRLQELFSFAAVGSGKTLVATFLTSLIYLVGMAGQALGGRLADRIDLRLGYVAFHAASLPFVFLLFVLPPWALPFAAAGYVFFAMGMQPLENSIVARLGSARSRGLVYGLKFTLTFGVGALAVECAAYIQDRASITAVFGLTALSALATALLALAFTSHTRTQDDRFRRGAPQRSGGA